MKIEKFIFYIFLANFTLISAFGVLETYKEASLEVKNPFSDAEKYKSDTQNYIDRLNEQINEKRAEIQGYIGQSQKSSSIDNANLEIKKLKELIAYLKQNLDNFKIEETNYNSAQTFEERKKAIEAARQIRGMQLEKNITIVAEKKYRGLTSDDIKAFNNLVDVSVTAKLPLITDRRQKRILDLSALAKNIVKEAQGRASELFGAEFSKYNPNITKQLNKVIVGREKDENLNNALNYAVSNFYKEIDSDESRISGYVSSSVKKDLLEKELHALNKYYSQVVQSLRKVSNNNIIFPDRLSLDTLMNFSVLIKKN